MRAALLLVCLLPLACVTLREPGTYLPSPRRALPSTAIKAQLQPFRWSPNAVASGYGVEANDETIGARVSRTFAAELEASGLFAQPAEGEPVEVLLEGEIERLEQPDKQGAVSSGGDSNGVMAVVMAVYAVAVLFGAPTQCSEASVALVLRARDAQYGQVLHEWRAQAQRRSCAGLYYRAWPLAEALDQAAAQLLTDMGEEAPELEGKLQRLAHWTEGQGIDLSADPQDIRLGLVRALGVGSAGVRARAAEALGRLGAGAESATPALLLAASDPDRGVRRHAVAALLALGLEDEAALASLAASETDEQIGAQLRAARKQVRFRLLARTLPLELQATVEALGGETQRERTAALTALTERGASGRLAARALEECLRDDDRAIQLAAVDAMRKLEIEDEAPRRTLVDLAESDETHPELRQAAAQAARQLELASLAKRQTEGKVEVPAAQAPAPGAHVAPTTPSAARTRVSARR